MELGLQSPLALVPNSFNVLIGPEEILVDSLNYKLTELQRLQVLYVSGNYSRILDKLDRRFTELDVRRAFTAHQLLTILKEAYQTLIILEHDQSLFEDASEMSEYVGQALKEVSNGSSVLLYSPWTDRHLERSPSLPIGYSSSMRCTGTSTNELRIRPSQVLGAR